MRKPSEPKKLLIKPEFSIDEAVVRKYLDLRF